MFDTIWSFIVSFVQADWANIFFIIGALACLAFVVFTLIYPFIYPQERIRWGAAIFAIVAFVPYTIVWIVRGIVWLVRALFCDC